MKLKAPWSSLFALIDSTPINMSSGPQDEESLEEKLDLSSLLDADFGPAWGNESNSGPLGVGSGSNTSHPQKTRRKKGPNQDGLGKHNEKGSGRKPQRRSSKRSTGESFTARIPQKEEKPFQLLFHLKITLLDLHNNFKQLI